MGVGLVALRLGCRGTDRNYLCEIDFSVALELASKTDLQAGLRLDRFTVMQAMIRSTFGISALQSLKASGAHAARCSAVPTAKLVLAYADNASPTTTGYVTLHIFCLKQFRFICLLPLSHWRPARRNYSHRTRLPDCDIDHTKRHWV